MLTFMPRQPLKEFSQKHYCFYHKSSISYNRCFLSATKIDYFYFNQKISSLNFIKTNERKIIYQIVSLHTNATIMFKRAQSYTLLN